MKIFYFFQVLVIGDSIVRGIAGHQFDVRTFPGITSEKLLNEVVHNNLSTTFQIYYFIPLHRDFEVGIVKFFG